MEKRIKVLREVLCILNGKRVALTVAEIAFPCELHVNRRLHAQRTTPTALNFLKVLSGQIVTRSFEDPDVVHLCKYKKKCDFI